MNSLTPRLDRLEHNIMINGAMEIAQRGVSGMLSNSYTLDRFYVDNQNSSMTTLIDQSTTVPSGEFFSDSLRVYNTTTGSLAADTQVDVRYRVEGFDIAKIWKPKFTLSFWARSSIAGTYSISLKNDGASHTQVKTYTLDADTWKFITMSFDGLSSAPGAWNRTEGVGLEVKWSIVTGTDFQTVTLDSWQAGNFEKVSTQDNEAWLTSGNEFYLTGTMITSGDFEGIDDLQFVRSGKSFAEEVAKAERYYEKSYQIDTAPATAVSTGALVAQSAGSQPYIMLPFKTRKRSAPTLTTWSTTGTSGSIRVVDGGGADVGVSVVNSGGEAYGAVQANSSITGGFNIQFHYAADAEL